jgi:hypothetical protein
MTVAEFSKQHGLSDSVWWQMTPAQRWDYSQNVLWPKWFALGGTTGPEWDPTDPMHEMYVEMGIYHAADIPLDSLSDANIRRVAYLKLGGVKPGGLIGLQSFGTLARVVTRFGS